MSFSYDISKEIIISENTNKILKLSWIKWGSSDKEKIDIRNWYEKPNLETNELIAGKGISLDEESANELTNILVENNLGDPERIANALGERCGISIDIPEEFKNNTNNINDNVNYIDPNDILGL